jgi:hypothetical protein
MRQPKYSVSKIDAFDLPRLEVAVSADHGDRLREQPERRRPERAAHLVCDAARVHAEHPAQVVEVDRAVVLNLHEVEREREEAEAEQADHPAACQEALGCDCLRPLRTSTRQGNAPDLSHVRPPGPSGFSQ